MGRWQPVHTALGYHRIRATVQTLHQAIHMMVLAVRAGPHPARMSRDVEAPFASARPQATTNTHSNAAQQQTPRNSTCLEAIDCMNSPVAESKETAPAVPRVWHN